MAAGLGFKTFTTGEVLTAADVNGYLMQGVLVFASAAARNAAITSPQEGQFAFTKDTNGLWYYDGAAWVASGATGDIEGVTAGVGITGGGTSGTVTITNDMATTITASGDIIVGTGSGTYDNLPIGTTGQLLTADTTVSPYKVKWATPAAAASGLTLISRQTFSNVATTTTTFDGVFTSTYKTYLIAIEDLSGATPAADLYLQYRVGATTTAGTGYLWNNFIMLSNQTTTNVGARGVSQIQLSRNCGASSYPGSGEFWVNKVGNASQGPKLWGGYQEDNSEEFQLVNAQQTSYNTYTGFILSASTGNISGTVAVYGLAAA